MPLTVKPLFNPRILRREVERLVSQGHRPPSAARELLSSWRQQLASGTLATYTEPQVEQAFNATIFEKILGYTPIGRGSTHHILPKASSQSGKNIPDFVLGTFNRANGVERWRVVGEIKAVGVKLDLPQVSRRNPETPVQQAFRYALQGRPGVEWVVVTNVSEIRLYRNGYSANYHSWTLDELGDGVRLDEFYVLLRREHIAPDHGDSETLRILNESLSAGLALTEGFYGLYDLARRKLIDTLRLQPALRGASEIDIYGKAHKLLNRVLFAAFCEDHPSGLLPPGTLERLHGEATARHKKGAYWGTFKRFFRDLDRGSPPGASHAYNAFNGGLFAPDPMLDRLELPDSLFVEPLSYRARRVGSREIAGIFGFHAYDFSEELDVDSLGAIFEQSLKDLPHIAHARRGHGTTEITRREATGVFYTPPAITQFLVARALSAFLAPVRAAILAEIDRGAVKGKLKVKTGRRALSADDLRNVLFQQRILERLKTVTFIDPACGSGAFLVEALRQFHDEYERANSALGRLMGGQPMFGLDRLILRNNLYGVDILAESVEIARLSIWLRTAVQNEPLEKLDTAIVCADSLRMRTSQAYDLVVSNPPWGAQLSGWTDEEVKARFPACGEEKDTYALFLIRGYELLKPGGVLAYIMPNSWLTVEGYAPLRKWVLEHFEVLEIVNVWKVFKDVNHDACLFVARRPAPKTATARRPRTSTATIASLTRGTSEAAKAQCLAEERWHRRFDADPREWLDEDKCRFETMYEPSIARELDRVASRSQRLGDLCDVTVGIQVYHRRKVPESVIRSRAFHSDRKKGRDYYPYIDGNEVQRYYQVPSEQAYLLYSDKLCDKRELQHYTGPRILVQQIFWQRLSACLSEPETPVLYLNTLFSVTARERGVDLAFVLATLNSRLMSAAYEHWTNRLFGDKFPKVSKVDLARLPIPRATRTQCGEFRRLGCELGEQWSQLKHLVTEFAELVAVSESSGELSRGMVQFWNMSRADVVAALSRVRGNLAPTASDRLLSSWQTSVRGVNQTWSRICDLEAEVEMGLRDSLGIEPSLYAEIISRTPEITLETVLLPR